MTASSTPTRKDLIALTREAMRKSSVGFLRAATSQHDETLPNNTEMTGTDGSWSIKVELESLEATILISVTNWGRGADDAQETVLMRANVGDRRVDTHGSIRLFEPGSAPSLDTLQELMDERCRRLLAMIYDYAPASPVTPIERRKRLIPLLNRRAHRGLVEAHA